MENEKKNKAHQLKAYIPAVYLALKSKETPKYLKILCGIIVVYALSPIDLIPDFIPVLGYLDDLVILPALIVLLIRLMPKDLWEQFLTESESVGNKKFSEKWYYGIPFAIIWLALIYWLLHIFKIV